MPLKHFTEHSPSIVGSYSPSKEWSQFTHFAVMESQTGTMVASVGYFQNILKTIEWGFDDYKNAAECIEQAQLYANAPKLLKYLEELVAEPLNSTLRERARQFIYDTLDISEPLTRLLGEHAPQIVDQAVAILDSKEKDVKGSVLA